MAEVEKVESNETTENTTGMDELKAQLEEIKAVQSGSDKKVSELQKANEQLLEALATTKAELDETKKTSMSASEKAEFEREQLEKERAELKREKLEIVKTKAVAELEIPAEFAPFIQGDTEDAIRLNAQKIKEIYDKKLAESVETKVNEKLTEAGAPESGDKPKPMKEWDGTIKSAMGLSDEEVAAELLKQIEGD